MSASKTVYAMLEECSRSMADTFSQQEILSWFRRRYPDARESTIRAHIQATTSNAPNREQHHPSLAARRPLFDRISHGVYRVHQTNPQTPVGANSRASAAVKPLARVAHRDPGSSLAGSSGPRPHADLVLVSCVKSKLSRPAAAKDLYTSALFVRERAYAENAAVPWFILSAEHGLVSPDQVLEPYERYLPACSPDYRLAWGTSVAAELERRVGPLGGKVLEIHAGSAYLDALRQPLRGRGAVITEPLRGLRMGERLAWYSQQSPASFTPIEAPQPANESAIESIVATLLDRSTAVSPEAFLAARGDGLSRPGLYSWWVDETGAHDLTAGLGIALEAGLIYAGLAGATHWPSGKRSTNTLWLRIATMHLAGSIEFSTFRLTLGSILTSSSDPRRVDETALTNWMHQHLRVVAKTVDDADTLGHLEKQVLGALDPPFNLQGMEHTAIRIRLSELRKQVSR